MNAPGPDSASSDREFEIRLVEQIRAGDSDAWQQLIDRFEGRLLAFAKRRLNDTSTSEDIVQETFVGFLVSLPNFDSRRRLESYLFSICSYKLTDHLRHVGRRPELPLLSRSTPSGTGSGEVLQADGMRLPSSICRSAERRALEQDLVVEVIREQVANWQSRGNFSKLKAIEMLFVLGRGNREVAERLDLTQQQVANLKSDFLTRIAAVIKRRDLNLDVFPELRDEPTSSGG
ncbi:sigma-70 family RNA polymerase sigma factor [Rhodopirellula sp. JC740]|uniref:Sigma-70 family RNA polymerase sigma factor n=1 Tax=Rhodopirellula halodulae TaxID=2894198 RepID=A0ABS8NER1_9BACT|nr:MULTISPECIES: sigma-70 family RNA polymerase sigma factor [unclassified Rhodopirellula]MCC9642051.1 sigma-70 family RNA polymerase sigma factor [Rhodopirellula sp. JC740]MCC9658332.1 sigma-70 family RNA polymerase sigma factor [Rhodopirellula sp. JC737]